MKTYVIEVKPVVERDYLDDDDRKACWDLVGLPRFQAASEEDALTQFHATMPISVLEHFEISVREGKPLKLFYVTMTWDNWPEGGSFGTKVLAEDHADAERLCRRDMATHRASDDDEELDEFHYLDAYGDEWVTVDCFPLDDFIAMHSKGNESPDRTGQKQFEVVVRRVVREDITVKVWAYNSGGAARAAELEAQCREQSEWEAYDCDYIVEVSDVKEVKQ
jgi:hypothetical protein